MSDQEPEFTPEQDEEARQVWGEVWDLTRKMIASVQAWNAVTGTIAEIELPSWDELDDLTQNTFMRIMVQTPAMEIIGGAMAQSLRAAFDYRRATN